MRKIKTETLMSCAVSKDRALARYAVKLLQQDGLDLILDDLETEKLPDRVILDMYRSEDPFLIKKSKEAAVLQNHNFICFVINRWFPCNGPDCIEDMIQCGAIGVLRALEHYDGSRALTTYSKKYIIHEVSDFLIHRKNIPSPYYARLQKQIGAEIRRDKDVSDKEIAEKLGIRKTTVRRERYAMDVAKTVRLEDLDEFSENRIPLEDFVTDRLIISQAEQYIAQNLLCKEQKILWLRIVENKTFKEISSKVGMSKQGTVDCYRNAIRKIQELLGIF